MQRESDGSMPRTQRLLILPAASISSTVTVSWIATATNGPAVKRSIVLALGEHDL